MATRDRGHIVKTGFLPHRKPFALLALLVLASAGPSQAASESSAGIADRAAPTPPAPIQLAWDRVGSPIQIRV